MPSFTRAHDVPARVKDRPDQVMAREIPAEAADAVRDQVRTALHQPFQQDLLPADVPPRIAPSMAWRARAVSATMHGHGNGESSAVPVEPNMARFTGVSARVPRIASVSAGCAPSEGLGSCPAVSGGSAASVRGFRVRPQRCALTR